MPYLFDLLKAHKHVAISVHRFTIALIMLAFASLGIVGSASGDVSHRVSGKPNIILIISDDAGYADFGFQGSTKFHTPYLDSIAERGVVFNNAYASSAVCSPSRAGLVTGRYPNRFGIEFNLPGDPRSGIPSHERGLPLFELTLGDVLGQAGYQTGFIGKWHLGTNERYQPQNRGFAEYFGVLGGYSKYYAGHAASTTSNYRVVNPDTLPYLTDAIGNEAVGFVDRYRESAFFLLVSFTAPHPPMHAREDDLERFQGIFNTTKRTKNAAMMYRMDKNIGKILSRIKAHGLLENTIIVFTNDNNGSPGDNGASNGLLRGGKGTVLEGGIKAPLIVSWPAKLPKGNVLETPVSTLDILPTLVGAAGINLPGDRVYDGVNLLPVMHGRVSAIPHGVLFWRVNWASAVRKGNWKLVRTPDDRTWLYDLESDPGELINLAMDKKSVVEDLLGELRQWGLNMQVPSWTANEMWKRRATKRYYQ